MRIIAHISDVHFGRHDAAKAESLLASLEKERPHLVVVSGDLTQRARHREFAQARTFLQAIGAPKLVVPGNHDMPLFDIYARMFKPFEKFNAYIAPLRLQDNFFADSEIAVLGLNTARRLTGKNGRVSHEQIELIRRKFPDTGDASLRILVTHHPLSGTGGERISLAGRARLAMQALHESRVHLLLSGHHHHSAHGECDTELSSDREILVAHAGTAISKRTRGEGNTYNLIRVDGPELTLSVMDGTNGSFAPVRSTVFRQDGERWSKAA